jgi:hypothetical protein
MKKHILSSYLILALIAFALVGCFTVPDSIYDPIDPDVENAKTPHIDNVDKTAMWTDESLTITGSNFSDSLSENFVYFSTVNEPVGGTVAIVKDSLMVDGSYSFTNYFKDVDIVTSDYVTTITSTIAGVTTTTEHRSATTTEGYISSDSTSSVYTSIVTEPVFTLFDTTWADTTLLDTAGNPYDSSWVVSIDTTGYTKMVRTVTTTSGIESWYSHTAQLGTITSATPTQLVVTPPDVDVVNAKVTVQVQDAIAPAEWGYVTLMVKP